MSQLWIDAPALDEMLDEARRAYPLETGGILVGYVASNNEPVVQHIIGPGPAARHKRQRFHPDHDWQCHRLDDIFEASSGRAPATATTTRSARPSIIVNPRVISNADSAVTISDNIPISHDVNIYVFHTLSLLICRFKFTKFRVSSRPRP